MKILFICRGNHARSQMAEAIFNNLSKGKDGATSAGTIVKKDRHRVTDPFITEIMKEIDIDISEKIRNQLTPEIVEESDRIIVMAQPESIPEYLKDNKKAIYWEVPDPHLQSIEFARGVRKKIQLKVNEFIETLI